MPTPIDSLEIQIGAQAKTAENALNSLIKKLGDLDAKLSALNGNSLQNLSNGIVTLSGAMQTLNNSAVKTQDFTRLSNNLDKLGKVNFTNIQGLASGLNSLTSGFQGITAASQNAQSVTDMVTALARLGYASMDRAIQNMPQLASALRNMLTSLSSVPAISTNLIQMTNAIANLASQGGKVRSAASNLTSGFSQISTSATRTARTVNSLAAAFGKFYATYFLVIRGIKGIWKSIETSMDYVETYNYLSVTIDKMGKTTVEKMGELGEKSAEEYSDSFRSTLNSLTEKMTGYAVGSSGELIKSSMKNLGLNAEQLMNFQAKIGAVTNSVGMLGEQSVSAQKGLSMLAADLSSLTNTDLDTVMSNLASGMQGMSRAVYKYGIDLTQASLAEKAAELGIEKSITSMTQAEKMQLRLLVLLEDSEIAWGDQARTIDSVANQYRIFQQQLQNLARTLGSLFLPIVRQVLPVVNALIIALQNLLSTLGVKLYGEDWTTKIMDGISGSAADVGELEDNIEGVGDGLDDATASAKKLKQQLQGFDELNVITTKDSSGSGSGTPIDLTTNINDALALYESVWDDALNNMSDKVQEYLSIIQPKLEAFFSGFKKGFANMKTALGVIPALFKKLVDVLSKLSPSQIEKIGEAFGKLATALMLYSIGTKVASGITIIGTFFDKVVAFVSFFGGGTSTTVYGGLTNFLQGLSNLVSINPGAIGELGIALENLTSGSFFDTNTWFGGDYVAWKQDLYNKATEGFQGFADEMEKNIKESWYKVGEHFNLAGIFFDEAYKGWDDGDFDEFCTDMFNGIVQALLSLTSIITSPFEYVFNWIFDETGWGEKIDKFFETYVDPWFSEDTWTFSGIELGLTKAFSNGVSAMKGIWNKFADWFNSISTLEWDSVNFFGEEIIPKGSISLGKLPHAYANGGFVTSDVFFANENGIPELVGTVGGKTAVASGTEITGITDAVYATGETQSSLLQTAVGLLQVIANNGNGFNADQVFNSVRQSAYNYTARTGNAAFPI